MIDSNALGNGWILLRINEFDLISMHDLFRLDFYFDISLSIKVCVGGYNLRNNMLSCNRLSIKLLSVNNLLNSISQKT